MTFTTKQNLDGSLDVINKTTGNTVITLTASDGLTVPGAVLSAMTRAALAASGTDAATGATVSAQVTAVTASDDTKAVVLPAAATTTGPFYIINTVQTAGLKVFPVAGGNDAINAASANAAFVLGPGRGAWFVATSATQWYTTGEAAITATPTELSAIDGMLATATEINRTCDVSTRLVAAGGTLAVTTAAHDGKIIALDTAAGSVCTLPAATGSGSVFTFVVTVTPTSNAHIIKVTGDDVMYGQAFGVDGDGEPGNAWGTAADSDTVTMNSGTLGGEIGDRFVLVDIAADKYAVTGWITQSGTEATPFSATV